MKLNANLLADIFQSNMILPLNKDFKLGGIVNAGETVKVDFDQNHYETTANQKGEW